MTRRGLGGWLWRLLALGLMAAGIAGACDSSARIEVTVCGDVRLPSSDAPECRGEQPDGGVIAGESEISLVTLRGTTASGEQVYRATVDLCVHDLPITVSIRRGWDEVTVDVQGWGPAGHVHQEARPTFPASGPEEIYLGLTRACLNVECPIGRTCVSGVCEPIGDNPGSDACRGPAPDGDADVDTDVDTDTDVDVDVDDDVDVDVDVDTDIDVDTDTDIDVDSDVDTDSDVDEDPDVDPEIDEDVDFDPDIEEDGDPAA